MAASVRSIDGGKRAPSLAFSLPEPGSPEFYLWALILAEMGLLVFIRAAFKGAHGG